MHATARLSPQQIDLLETWYQQFHTDCFIADDPISVPHLFSQKQDIEITGFLTAIIAWGQRKTIIRNAKRLFRMMDNAPYEFILSATATERNSLRTFAHRTFQGEDCIYFVQKLTELYQTYADMESFLQTVISPNDKDISNGLIGLRQFFFPNQEKHRATKHFADIRKNAAAKRLCMFFRWMVRKDSAGIDFG
ncbi:MAG: DUF2400 domain-containing protein, partial [Bacteroidia bacterium]|nr:DUF2400 domain-containing protein [Bacteroidia bacterium]